ncbi:hypothetical protein ABZ642_33785 [Streptomyces sp. NPDC007157]|uniref:hypothetical protein n=1 Tax=Streptomyces sp. NPDC007157 TaxID=3154681 RepID=UPI0033FA708C
MASKLPPALQCELKIRCAELGLDIQDAVEAGITSWRASTCRLPEIDTSGAKSFSPWLPPGLYDGLKATCADRSVSYTQGLAQSIRLWLDEHPSPENAAQSVDPGRIINARQKGGVGKTTVGFGMGEAYAEDPDAGRDALTRFIASFADGDLKRIGKTKADVEELLDPQSHLSEAWDRADRGHAQNLWIDLGWGASCDAEGVLSRAIDSRSSSRPALQRGSGRHARAERAFYSGEGVWREYGRLSR